MGPPCRTHLVWKWEFGVCPATSGRSRGAKYRTLIVTRRECGKCMYLKALKSDVWGRELKALF